MKKINIIIIIVCLSIYVSFSQNFTYTYDASGNRISRTITVSTLKSEKIYDTVENALVDTFVPEQVYSDEVDNKQVKIYPNPTRGELVVQIPKEDTNSPFSIIVTDMSGKVIIQKFVMHEYTDIDITNNPNGMYILQIIADSKKSTEWKIIKK